MNRREVLQLGVSSLSCVAAAAAVGSAAFPARADDWPTKNFRVIIPYAAGSTTVGATAVARADPDGYTILGHSNAIVTVPAIQPSVPYDPVKDFSAITPLGNVPRSEERRVGKECRC